jgi:hypothetical protein
VQHFRADISICRTLFGMAVLFRAKAARFGEADIN